MASFIGRAMVAGAQESRGILLSRLTLRNTAVGG